MVRVPDRALDGCIFLYPSRTDAESGAPHGGCGFLIGMPWESLTNTDPHLQPFHVYAVTNHHVLISGNTDASVIRLNTLDGSTDIIETDPSEWEHHPGHDVAVYRCPLDSKHHKYIFDPISRLIDDDVIKGYALGVGDEVFALGRFIDVDGGSQRNLVVGRFGYVSLMPEAPVAGGMGGRYESSYLIEMRSRTGFSGSPVYIYLPPVSMEWVEGRVGATYPREQGRIYGPWILGIQWGQLPITGPEVTADERQNPKQYGSGMSGVVPARYIRDLLMGNDKLINERRAFEDEYNSRPKAILESELPTVSEPPTTEGDEQHKERFTSLLNVAARKRPPAD